MARESGEITNPFDDRREWMGRDIDKVEVYGSDVEDIERESDFQRASDHRTALLIGSAAVAAVAITSIVLLRRKSRRENEENEAEEYEYQYEAEPEEKNAAPSMIRRLADRQKKRLSDTVDDIIDALVGTACAKMVSLISDAVPDFRSEYERTNMTR